MKTTTNSLFSHKNKQNTKKNESLSPTQHKTRCNKNLIMLHLFSFLFNFFFLVSVKLFVLSRCQTRRIKDIQNDMKQVKNATQKKRGRTTATHAHNKPHPVNSSDHLSYYFICLSLAVTRCGYVSFIWTSVNSPHELLVKCSLKLASK